MTKGRSRILVGIHRFITRIPPKIDIAAVGSVADRLVALWVRFPCAVSLLAGVILVGNLLGKPVSG